MKVRCFSFLIFERAFTDGNSRDREYCHMFYNFYIVVKCVLKLPAIVKEGQQFI